MSIRDRFVKHDTTPPSKLVNEAADADGDTLSGVCSYCGKVISGDAVSYAERVYYHTSVCDGRSFVVDATIE